MMGHYYTVVSKEYKGIMDRETYRRICSDQEQVMYESFGTLEEACDYFIELPGVTAPFICWIGEEKNTFQNLTEMIRFCRKKSSKEKQIIVYTPEDIMKILGIGRSMAYRLLSDGKIRSIRIGKLYRIPAHYLEDYLSLGYNSNNSQEGCL